MQLTLDSSKLLASAPIMSIMDLNHKKVRLPSTHDDDLSNDRDHIGRIRVGKDFQVPVPRFTPSTVSAESQADPALTVWSPTDAISDVKLSNYLLAAKEKFGYNEEQALGMLFWHRHNLKNAITDLANFTPCPEDWSVEDRSLFEQAFQFHGKNFYGIRTMIPQKQIAQIVKFYYTWKKTKHNISLIDKYQKKRSRRNATSENNGSTADVDEDISDCESYPSEKKWKPGCQQKAPVVQTRRSDSQGEGFCSNCNIHCNNCYPTAKGKMCGSCHAHFKRTGALRPTMANDVNTLSVLKLRKYPPKGMYLNHDDLSMITVDEQANTFFYNLSREIVAVKRVIQYNKQHISEYLDKHSSLGSIAKYRAPPVAQNPVISSSWTNAELTLAVQGIHKYGKDCKAIAEVIGTKSETHVKHFYNKYRACYNLDTLLTDNDAAILNATPEPPK